MAWNLDSGPTKRADGTVTREKFLIKWNRDKEGNANRKTNSKPLPLTLSAAESFAILLLIGGVLAIVALVGGQVYIWAQTGHWLGVSTGDLIATIAPGTPIGAWIAAPTSWLGLHQLVTETPLAVFIIVVFGGIGILLVRN